MHTDPVLGRTVAMNPVNLQPARANLAASAARPTDESGATVATPTLDSLAATYDGPIVISDVNQTLTNPGYHNLPYVGVRPMLHGIASMNVPLVYVACNSDEQKSVERFPQGTIIGPPTNPVVTTGDGSPLTDSDGNPVTSGDTTPEAMVADSFKTQTLKSLQSRFPSAHFMLLGNDQGNDPKIYQDSGSQSWIRNVRADQSTIPDNFSGTLRDVYSPNFIQNVLDNVHAACENSTSLGGTPGAAPAIAQMGPPPFASAALGSRQRNFSTLRRTWTSSALFSH